MCTIKYGYKRTMTRKSRSRTNSRSCKRIITVAHWSTFPSDEIVSGRTWRRARMSRIMPSILEHNYRCKLHGLEEEEEDEDEDKD